MVGTTQAKQESTVGGVPSHSEFQAVILASGNDGDNLYPLTEQTPLPLLPVANRPLISYQLELLERAGGFHEVLILVAGERQLSRMHAYAGEQPHTRFSHIYTHLPHMSQAHSPHISPARCR
jgi:dTDP-glucose pyrophosphorylase